MKTKSFSLLFLLFICAFSKASDDTAISIKELPTKTQHFINTYFPDTEFSSILHREKYGLYQISTANLWRFTFGEKGNWIDIDCNEDRVPSHLVPSPILNIVARKYGPSTTIVKIAITRRGNYMIKLSNYIRLSFDKKYRELTIEND